jgi:hypothetical protein
MTAEQVALIVPGLVPGLVTILREHRQQGVADPRALVKAHFDSTDEGPTHANRDLLIRSASGFRPRIMASTRTGSIRPLTPPRPQP